MKEPLVILPDDPLINALNFKPYRNMLSAVLCLLSLEMDSLQTMEVTTPWGAKLTVRKGDLLVSELEKPDDIWPVDPVHL